MFHFEKIMVQDTSENNSRNPITACATGSELLTSSQKFTSSHRLPKCTDVNRFPLLYQLRAPRNRRGCKPHHATARARQSPFHCNRRNRKTESLKNVWTCTDYNQL